LQLYADGGYQLRIRSLEGTPNYGPRHVPTTVLAILQQGIKELPWHQKATSVNLTMLHGKWDFFVDPAYMIGGKAKLERIEPQKHAHGRIKRF
jgi:hypothetical protein